MNWSTSLSWLSSTLKSSPPAAAGGADPADMGTAFGLDASFDGLDARAAPVLDTAAAAPLPWEHRLTRRTGL